MRKVIRMEYPTLVSIEKDALICEATEDKEENSYLMSEEEFNEMIADDELIEEMTGPGGLTPGEQQLLEDIELAKLEATEEEDYFKASEEFWAEREFEAEEEDDTMA